MRKTKRIIIYAWLLLFFFAAGQYMVFAHQHYKQQGTIVSVNKFHSPVFKENCAVCDVMHHTHMLLTQHVYFAPAVVAICHYQYKQYDLKFIQLILASGRAPPVS